jgi:hypothetical protein
MLRGNIAYFRDAHNEVQDIFVALQKDKDAIATSGKSHISSPACHPTRDMVEGPSPHAVANFANMK